MNGRTMTAVAAALLLAAVIPTVPDACTTIMVGRRASVDGSVTTSHTCDSRIDRTWFELVPPGKHRGGSACGVYSGLRFMRFPGDTAGVRLAVEIPQIERTHGYINTAYPCMNDRQLAVGESTFGGREELRNKSAGFSCEELCRIALERAATCREAITVIGVLVAEYGYNYGGECLTFADPQEAWEFEILGCGGDCIGAVWAAQRIPDDHVGVNANAARILEIDLDDTDHFMASENIFDVAIERLLGSRLGRALQVRLRLQPRRPQQHGGETARVEGF